MFKLHHNFELYICLAVNWIYTNLYLKHSSKNGILITVSCGKTSQYIYTEIPLYKYKLTNKQFDQIFILKQFALQYHFTSLGMHYIFNNSTVSPFLSFLGYIFSEKVLHKLKISIARNILQKVNISAHHAKQEVLSNTT